MPWRRAAGVVRVCRVSARVLCLTLPIPGHVMPLAPVLAELARRGSAVRVVSAPSVDALLASTGAEVVHYPQAASAVMQAPSENFLVVAAALGTLCTDGLVVFACAQAQEFEADVVLLDSMAPWGRIAAERLGLPAVTSSSSFLISAQLGLTPRAAADVVLRLPAGLPALGRLALANARVRRRARVRLGGPVRMLSNRTGATIVHTSAALQPGSDRFGDDVHLVGATAAGRTTPAQPAPGSPLALALADAEAGAELIYVSLGTLYNRRPAFLRMCALALAGPRRRVVISLGDGVDPGALGDLPAGVLAAHMPPQLPILDRANLFVTHAGLNSVHEALWRGAPMLCFPQAADQPVVAARVADLGAGTVLRGSEPSVETVRAAAAHVLGDPAYAERAASLGEGLRGGGAARAADVVVEAAAT